MSKARSVWGIDIGQCALKAMRCTWDEKEERVVSDVFDFIEYPKILSQPDAKPDELVHDALEEFLSRNEIKGDRIAISVSGQVGLSRFFKPPPVDLKTLPKVVEFEAKQQIPFPLDDVIWDYQRLGGMEVDGLIIDAEVGIFAMKREAVFRALQPYLDADLEIDIVQLAPLATHNCILHEVLQDAPDIEEIDPDSPPPSLVVLSVGTDTTDLVVTDGHKVWLRNIPIGGSHFTKQLSRDLKLTYAKAEHVKRNARKAEDPKRIFQAMRPVFSDLVTEIQRSLNFFQGIEKKAEIGKIVMLGNAAKLPGLRQYLGKHLGNEIIKLTEFSEVAGASTQQPSFESNLLSFPVAYGLCLQGLRKGGIKTNLLPREFKIQRLIRAKKPWALAGIGVLMLAFGGALLIKSNEAFKTDPRREYNGISWEDVSSQVETVSAKSSKLVSLHNGDINQLENINALAEEVAAITDERRFWPDLLSIISQTRPTDERINFESIADPEKVSFEERDVVYLTSIESEYFKDLGEWNNEFMQKLYKVDLIESGMAVSDEDAAAGEVAPEAVAALGADAKFRPGALVPSITVPAEGENPWTEQSGWVIEISAYHYKNDQEQIKKGIPTGRSFVQKEWLNKMRTAQVTLPGLPDKFTLKELGIDFMVVASEEKITQVAVQNLLHPSLRGLEDPNAEDPDQMSGNPNRNTSRKKDEAAGPAIEKSYLVRKYACKIQFVWQPVSLTKRREIVEERELVAQAEAAAAEAAKNAESAE